MQAYDNELLALAATHLGDALVISDEAGVVLFWNDAAHRLFGWSAQDVIGQSLDLIIPERFRERHWEGYRAAMGARAVSSEGRLLEVPALHRDGRIISIAFTVALVTYGAEAAPAIAAVLRDDTEHRTERRWLSNRIKELESEAATRAGLSPQR